MNTRRERQTNSLGTLVLCLAIVAGATLMAGLAPASAQEFRTPISTVPYTISEAGSYYLTKSLSAGADQNGITVDANDVTVDLNGFSLIGLGSGDKDGITMKDRTNVEVRNGTIRDWGGYGVLERGSNSVGHRIVDLRVASSGKTGIRLLGYNHLIKECTTSHNGTNGITAQFGCTLRGNTACWNVLGIDMGSGCLATDNTVYGNAKGMLVEGKGNLVKANVLRNNSEKGIDVAGTDNAIEENLVTLSSIGIYFGQAGNFYADNRVADCATSFGGSVPTEAGDGDGNKSF